MIGLQLGLWNQRRKRTPLSIINSYSPLYFWSPDYVTIDGANAAAGDQVSAELGQDSAGRSATQSTQGDQPTLVSAGGDVWLEFDKDDGTSGDHLVIPSPTLVNGLTGFTLWVEVDCTATPATPEQIVIEFSNNSPAWFFALSLGGVAGQARMYLGPAGTNFCTYPSLTFGKKLFCFSYAGGGAANADRLKLYLDSPTVEYGGVFGGTIASSIANIARGSMGAGLRPAITSPADVRIGTVLLVPSTLNATQRTDIDTQIKALRSWY